MKIAMISAFEESVPPQTYGGTELVVSNLTEELVQLGHDVTLLATGDSKTKAQLIPIFQKSIRQYKISEDLESRNAIKYVGLGKALEYLNGQTFDIIHQHQMWRFLPFSSLLKPPVVSTLHGPLNVTHQQLVYQSYKQLPYISISMSQRQPLPELNYIANVYNGIDIDKFHFNQKPKDYYAFLGRMSPEKGPVQAIEIAKKANIKLIMAGKVDTTDQQFFNEQIRPKIDGEQITFIGEINHEQKVDLLSNAQALIAPIQWEEPFGLFFIEAMACGTPVITMRHGSTPEIITDKITGFICQSIEEAVASITNVASIDRSACLDHVTKNFSAKKMALGYVSAYETCLRSQ